MKFTPGPWRTGAPLEPLIVLACDERSTIVTEVSGAPSNPSAVADATLIAAAPDLYEALLPFAAAGVSDDSACHAGITTKEKCARCARILRALAALAKAEGKS